MTEIVVHRVNNAAKLAGIDTRFGVEIDIRSNGRDLILNHDPFKGGELFQDFLGEYRHGLLVLDIKETGIETEVLRMVRRSGIKRFFLLDVEFPYLYRASREGERAIAARYSEDESIETVLRYAGKVDWVWIDTISRLPLDADVVRQLKGFKTCLVCPERWGRPGDIALYRKRMRDLKFAPDAVMTAARYAEMWL